MPFERSSKPVVFHRRWMIVKVFPDAGTGIMPGYLLMITVYYKGELVLFIFSHQFETHRNVIRQLENGR